MSALKLIKLPKSYIAKANIIKQFKEASFKLVEIEGEFLDLLFNENNPLSYEQTFELYRTKFNNLAGSFPDQFYNSIEFDPCYFTERYRPRHEERI